MRPQPLIAVADVETSSRWYQRLLGVRSGHGGPDYEQLLHGDDLVLQLHAWDAEDDEHAHLGDRGAPTRGNGVLLWFQVDDFPAAAQRAHELGAQIIEDVHRNENANQWECWLCDPDGYTVVLASAPGAAGA